MIAKIRDLWRYAAWADEKLVEAIAAAGPGGAPAARELAHLIAAQELWLARLQGRPSRLPVWPDPSPDLGALADLARRAFDSYLVELSESDLGAAVTYLTTDGRSFTNSVEDILQHVSLHAQYHRGKANLLLRQAGREPAPADYIAFVRGGAAATAPGAPFAGAGADDRMVATLRAAAGHAESYLAGLATRPVAASASLDELRERLGGPLPQRGTDPVQVIDDLVAATAGGLLGSAGGRFFAWVIGGSLPSALAADWLTSTWDQNAALHACSPAAAVAEEVAGAWLIDLFGLPAEVSFAFTTGCQMAHFTALAAAREALLRDRGWDVGERGLAGSPPLRLIVSEHRHGSVERAVRFLGLGTRNVVPLVTGADGRVTVDVLAAALARDREPAIVVLDAADLNAAAFDPFASLIPLAKAAGAWVHVDGAFGLFARASRARGHLTAGIEAADSWAADAHKWLNVPFDCGVAFVRDRAAHRAAMGVSASYIAAATTARDQIDWNPEWSRRGRGFVVYAALRELGREGLADLVDRTCRYAAAIVAGLGELPGAEILWLPHLNQGLVRFRDPRPAAQEAAHDARTDAVIAAANATGEAFFSGTTWRGQRAMRISVVNWRTSDDDVQRAVAAVRAALATL